MWNRKRQRFETWPRADSWLMVRLGLEPKPSHPSLFSGCSLKGHKHTDTDRVRNVYPSVFGQVPQKLPWNEDLCARGFMCTRIYVHRNSSQEKAVKEWGSRTGWEGSQIGTWLQGQGAWLQGQSQSQPEHKWLPSGCPPLRKGAGLAHSGTPNYWLFWTWTQSNSRILRAVLWRRLHVETPRSTAQKLGGEHKESKRDQEERSEEI